MGQRTIEVVIPAYNEECSIGRTIEALFNYVATLPYRFELIVVNDGSQDRTGETVKQYSSRYAISLIELTRNFGKETALLAGLDLARGDATIIMDADMQHPVELIEKFLAEWENGYQCVYGIRRHRADESLFKRVFTKVFYLGLNSGATVRIVPDALDFRLLDRSAVKALCSLRERVRFTKGLYAWLGFRSIGIPFVPAPRVGGASRFDRRSLFALGWDAITSFSDLPLRLSGLIGGAVAVGSLGYGLYIAARTLIFGIDVPGWATLTVAITLLGGMQLLFLGILGRYLRCIFIEAKHRPNYLVAELSGLAAKRDTLTLPAAEHGGRDRQMQARAVGATSEADRFAAA